MERFMRMEGEQIQAAQMHSMAADELSPLIPAVGDTVDEQGEPWSPHLCSADVSLLATRKLPIEVFPPLPHGQSIFHHLLHVSPVMVCMELDGTAPNMHSTPCL